MAEPAPQEARHGLQRLVPRSVRVRTTVAAVLVVGVALVLGSVALVVSLQRSMFDQLRATAALQADDIAETLEAGRPLDEFDDDDDRLVQVLDSRGRVVAASEDLEDLAVPVAHIDEGESVTVTVPVDDAGPREFVVVAEDVEIDDEDHLVLVGRSTGIVSGSTRSLIGALVVGVPLLVLLVGGTTWWVVGRALAPVEALRREVDAVSSEELHRRVPDPATRDEIALLAGTMNRMLERLDRSQRQQRRFISDASHELRSPVAAIRQHAEVALAHPGTTSLDEFARTVLAEDLRVQGLVEDLLFLARSDEGAVPTHRRLVDLDDAVLDEARHLRGFGHIGVDTSQVAPVRVRADPGQLARVLRNLGENALRHARSTVRLTLHAQDGWAVCGVEDDGAGVPVAERDRIFERFVRLDEARARDDGGSGLGLAVSRQIMTGLGGFVRVTEAASGGARFEVLLPAVPEP